MIRNKGVFIGLFSIINIEKSYEIHQFSEKYKSIKTQAKQYFIHFLFSIFAGSKSRNGGTQSREDMVTQILHLQQKQLTAKVATLKD